MIAAWIIDAINGLVFGVLFDKWRERHGVWKAGLMAGAVVLSPFLLIGALLAAIILWPAPADAAPARADRCGIGLVAGMAGCITWEMKASEYRDLVARAMVGDEQAMLELADFEYSREDLDGSDNARQWWEIAARRGNCTAFRALIDEAERRESADAARWKQRARAKKCAPAGPSMTVRSTTGAR